MSNTVTITGNTFPVKEDLKALGGRWNPTAKGWDVPADKAEKARQIVAGAARVPFKPKATTTVPKHTRNYNWRPCGYPGCSRSYCDECDGEGYVNGR